VKAVVCHEFGPPEKLVVEEVPAPTLGPGQVLLDVHACSISFPDLLMLEDKYQFKPGLPFTPGGEVAGVVAAVADDVSAVAVGDRVLASTTAGGLAEQVTAQAASLIPIPDGVDLVEAAGFLYAYGT
jgi:NADPH2:quinone reductase